MRNLKFESKISRRLRIIYCSQIYTQVELKPKTISIKLKLWPNEAQHTRHAQVYVPPFQNNTHHAR